MFELNGKLPEDLLELFAAKKAGPLDAVDSEPQFGWVTGHHLLDTTIDETSAQLGGIGSELILMSRLDVMVSMDSAYMHMASIAGTPVVSVWGATHPNAGFMGWGQQLSDAVQADVPCRPCSISGKSPCLRGDCLCMGGITPEQIAGKVDAVLRRRRSDK